MLIDGLELRGLLVDICDVLLAVWTLILISFTAEDPWVNKADLSWANSTNSKQLYIY